VLEMIGKLASLFDRRGKVQLALVFVGTCLTALVEATAILAIYPLVELASGGALEDGVLGRISGALGIVDRTQLGLVLVTVLIGGFIVKDVGAVAFGWWQSGVLAASRVATSERLMRTFLRAPLSDHSRRSTSDLVRGINDSVGFAFNSALTGLIQAGTAAFSIASIVAVMVISTPLLTALLLGMLILVGAIYTWFVRPSLNGLGAEVVSSSGAAYRAAFHAFGSFKEVQIRNAADYFVAPYVHAANRQEQAGRRAGILSSLPKYLLEITFIVALGLYVIYTLGSGVPTSGLGGLAVVAGAGFRLVPGISSFISASSRIRLGAASVDVVHDALFAPGAAARRVDTERERVDGPLTFEDAVVLEDVGFTYPGGQNPAVSAVSLSIAKGSSFALVGESGSGKTTLADMLLGLHVPSMGSITVDGRPLKTDADRRAWQCLVASVPQDVYVLESTVLENVALEDPNPDVARVWRALDDAQLGDLVRTYPDGVESHVGERGSLLSGGQRQRLGIARALYREPQFLVLDEATSALDNETEHQVARAIRAMTDRNMTLVIIAHRLSTVRDADHVVLMSAGMIEAAGAYRELVDGNAHFRRLVELGSLN